MIFEKIIIHNLLSYYGTCYFDLTGVKKKKNIVLIFGRNNFGKTNFLNSIKLLFTGSKNDELRALGEIGQQKLSPKHYVLGKPGLWDGLLNKVARRDNENKCYISIEWMDDNGEKITAIRTWDISRNDFNETVRIELPEITLIGDEAEYYLQSILPNDFVPFFFFDGEKIQELAVGTEETRALQIERLLNIAPLKAVCSQLNELYKEYGKRLLTPAARSEVKQAEAQKSIYEASVSQKQIQLDDARNAEQDLQIELQNLKKQKDYFTVQGALNNEETIEAAILDLQQKINNEKDYINKELPRSILFWSCPDLLIKALDKLHLEQKSIADNDSSVLITLRNSLSSYLFEAPPHPPERLTDTQIEFFKEKIDKTLNIFEPTKSARNKNLGISFDRCKQTREVLLKYSPEGGQNCFTITQSLERISQLKRDLQTKREQLTGLASLSADERNRFEILEQRENLVNTQLIEQRTLIKTLLAELETEKILCKEVEKSIQEALDREKVALINDERRELCKKLNSFFNRFRDELRRQKKENIEKSLNEKFTLLMDSNDRVKHIVVDDNFTLEYKDNNGELVGRASISAGTKQLVAIALLWALNSASDKSIPVVIDTPLARIDINHQKTLLRKYYPNVGQQVIILPTDSELDEAKLKILNPYVYKHFILSNSDGKSTTSSLIRE